MLNMELVRVLVVDDHAHAREAICSILSEDCLFEVIGTASTGLEALELTGQWMPDLILMDVQMPDMDGLEATRQIKLRFPYVIIVMVTVSDDVTYLFEALKQGAQGYLLKNLAPSTWLEYLRAIVSDDAPLSKELAYRILQEFPAPRTEDVPDNPLTTRELEILQWVSAGYTNREIADQLGISDQTVKNHLKNILQKLHLENRVQLTRYALESGLAGRKLRK